MKATVFSKAVVMMAVVMASVMNFSASATTPADYVKNEEMTGELMTAKTIFRNEDGHLFRHAQGDCCPEHCRPARSQYAYP